MTISPEALDDLWTAVDDLVRAGHICGTVDDAVRQHWNDEAVALHQRDDDDDDEEGAAAHELYNLIIESAGVSPADWLYTADADVRAGMIAAAKTLVPEAFHRHLPRVYKLWRRWERDAAEYSEDEFIYWDRETGELTVTEAELDDDIKLYCRHGNTGGIDSGFHSWTMSPEHPLASDSYSFLGVIDEIASAIAEAQEDDDEEEGEEEEAAVYDD